MRGGILFSQAGFLIVEPCTVAGEQKMSSPGLQYLCVIVFILYVDFDHKALSGLCFASLYKG